MRSSLFAAAALGASLAALPAMAQSTHTNAANGTNTAATTTSTTGAAGTNTTSSVTNVPPSQSNPLMTQDGGVRVGKLIGTDVYNSKDQKLGSVDGVVINRNGQPEVIISHNSKLYQVPWNEMQFGNAKEHSNNKAMIPNMTENQLSSMQQYHYTAKS